MSTVARTPLKPEDLKVGMTVSGEQLSNIFGVWIYLDPESNDPDSAKILYFCSEKDKDDKRIQDLEDKYKMTRVYYMPSYYTEDEEVYD